MNIFEMAKFIKRKYNKIMSYIYIYISRKTTVRIGDLFAESEMTQYWHPVIAIRYLYIEDYYGLSNKGRDIYNKTFISTNADEIRDDNKRFDELIRSFEINGLNEKSYIKIDKNGTVFDGTHRLALCIWNNIDTIEAIVVPRRLRKISANSVISKYQLCQDDYCELVECYKRMIQKIHHNLQ